LTRAKKRPKTYLITNQRLKKTSENREKSGERPFAAKEWQEKSSKMSVNSTIAATGRKQYSCPHRNIFFAKTSLFSDFFVTLHCV